MTEVNELMIYSKIYPIVTETNLYTIGSPDYPYYKSKCIVRYDRSMLVNFNAIKKLPKILTVSEINNRETVKIDLNILIIRNHTDSKLISITKDKRIILSFEAQTYNYMKECIVFGVIIYIPRINIELYYERYKNKIKIEYSTWMI